MEDWDAAEAEELLEMQIDDLKSDLEEAYFVIQFLLKHI